MGEIDYNALFGLETAGADDGEVADTDAGTEAGEGEGEKEQTVAGSDEVGDGEAEGAEASEAETVKPEQTAEQNAQFAAARRRAEAERDKALADAKAQSEKEMNELIASMGLKDENGAAITTKAGYDQYKASQAAAEKAAQDAALDRRLKRVGLERTDLAAVVSELPEVVQAREAAVAMTAAKKEADAAKAKADFEAEMAKISEADPSIKTVDDLRGKPWFESFYKKVAAGNSLLDAYRLATYDEVMSQRAAAAKQSAINASRGKGHMVPEAARGTASASVPADVMREYRVFFPGATDAEIAKMYEREVSRGKGK